MLEQDLPVHECDSPFLGPFLEASDEPLLRAKSLHHKGYFAQACDAYVGVARQEGVTTLEERQVILQAALACAQSCGGAQRWSNTTGNFPKTTVAEIDDCIGMVNMQKVCVEEAQQLIAAGYGDKEELEQLVKAAQTRIWASTKLYNDLAYPKKLYETCIAIRHLCNFREDYPGLVRLYEKLLARTAELHPGAPDVLRRAVVRVCSSYTVRI